MKATHFILPLLVTLIINGCSEGEYSMSESSQAEDTEIAAEPTIEGNTGGLVSYNTTLARANGAGDATEEPVKTNVQIIQTAHYRLQVEDVDESTAAIQNMVEQYSAYFSNMELVADNYEKVNNITIRVPASEFDDLLKDIEGEAIFVAEKQIQAQDVTEEFVDIQARLKTKREVLARYMEILKDKAKTVEEVLNAERQIQQLQEEIEAKEGKLKYLVNKVAFSTINLEIYQKVEYQQAEAAFVMPYGTKLKNAFLSGWSVIKEVFVVLITLWPLWIVIGLIVWRRRNFKKWLSRMYDTPVENR